MKNRSFQTRDEGGNKRNQRISRNLVALNHALNKFVWRLHNVHIVCIFQITIVKMRN